MLLLNEEPMHGYQLMQSIGERTQGRWSPSPGAIYPTISQLEDEGLVETSKEGGRKLATLTDAGRAHVEEQSASWSDPFGTPGSDEEQLPDVRFALHDLGGAVREAARSADAAQLAQVVEILGDARRSIYRILAGDAPAAPTADPSAQAGPSARTEQDTEADG
ncbi:PadR family transcriptional regulator [Brachybacterium sp. DNPG3]